jgi:hypothetical protein
VFAGLLLPSKFPDGVQPTGSNRENARDASKGDFCDATLFAICTGTFSKLCTVACRRVLSGAPLQLTASRSLVALGNQILQTLSTDDSRLVAESVY